MPIAQYLEYALPIYVGVAALEAAILIFVAKRAFPWRSSLASLANAITRDYVVPFILPFNLAGLAIYWAATHQLHWVPAMSASLSFAIAFLGQELAYYWFHRASHRVRWFWTSHAVHHSPNEINFAMAYRVSFTSAFNGGLVFYAPLIWIGFSPGAVFLALGINLAYQFWIHCEWCPKLGPLEYVLNTPSHHRVHHAANLDYLDANYGGMLIVFDRIFGTFVAERRDLPCRYGLVKPLVSNNPLYIEFHEWLSLAHDLWRARSPGDVLGYLFGPPGWRPHGKGLTTAALRRAAASPVQAVPAE
jgi:sterol desaturase/sphingolipid hydroxylase (fatty acid hydroxylase superfamily)